jgi:hypothetical protein
MDQLTLKHGRFKIRNRLITGYFDGLGVDRLDGEGMRSCMKTMDVLRVRKTKGSFCFSRLLHCRRI